MRLAWKAWMALPCGLVLVFLAGLGILSFAPKPLVSSTLTVGAADHALFVPMPSPAAAYIAPAPEDPFTRTDELLREIDQKLSK